MLLIYNYSLTIAIQFSVNKIDFSLHKWGLSLCFSLKVKKKNI